MKNAFLKLLTSVKFWTTIIGGICTALGSLIAKYGFEVSDAAVQQVAVTISGLFGLLLFGQAATDHGKEAAKIKSSTESGSARLGVLLMIALIGFVVITAAFQVGCAALSSSTKQAGGDLYSCAKAEPKKLIEQFGPAMVQTVKSAIDNRGKPDVEQLRPVAAALQTDAARCVLTAAIGMVGRALAPAAGSPLSSEMPVDGAALHAGYDQLRAELWAGKRYELGGGP